MSKQGMTNTMKWALAAILRDHGMGTWDVDDENGTVRREKIASRTLRALMDRGYVVPVTGGHALTYTGLGVARRCYVDAVEGRI